MQCTHYFLAKQRENTNNIIEDRWIRMTYLSPEFRVKQKDGRYSLYSKIDEMNNRYLRLILLKDGKTVKDAFFDKNFSPRAAAKGRLGLRL